MRVFSATFVAAALLFLVPAGFVRGDEDPVTLSNHRGASVTFVESDGMWRWTGLTTPNVPGPGSITDEGTPITSSIGTDVLAAGWSLVEQAANKLVFEQGVAAAGLVVRRIFSFGPAPNVVRIETWVRNAGTESMLTRAGLLDLRVSGEAFHETGAAPASFPLFGRALFVGIEHVSGTCRSGGNTAHLWQNPHVKVGADWQFVAAAIVGWTLPSTCSIVVGDARIREAFLQYLDTIRIKPVDMELHTNTWWTLGLPYAEEDVLRDIEALRSGFTERTGMFFDSFAMDAGWSDTHSLWRADADRFPNEFRAINDRLAALGCRLGLWLSPGSAYPEAMDNAWLESNGYEMTPSDLSPYPGRTDKVPCFALGGRYQQAFKDSIVTYARRYGIGHVKLDFMAHTCDVASHGHPTGPDSTYAIDAGLADIFDSLRALSPTMALEPLCAGYPPSPWWTTKTPYMLGPNGEDLPYGRVPCPDWMESLISARDIAYRADQEKWIMPTQALETFDIVVQNPGNFENLAVMAIGRGRWFISTYLNPELMSPSNWDFLAALVRWARANKMYLENALMIGGKPENREAYGYLFHNAGKDIYCVRNPWIEERSIQLPACTSVRELRDLRMIYPRRETVARLEPGGEGLRIVLAPYETVMLETVPTSELNQPAPPRLTPEAIVSASEPQVSISASDEMEPTGRIHYSWNAELAVPDNVSAELFILVEGNPQVENALCSVSLSGSAANVRVAGSAGQFAAAGEPSPDNWIWFIVPVAPGSQSLQIGLDVPLKKAAIGVYLAGSTSADSDAEPAEGPVFPLFRPTQRGWSQTLLPVKSYATDAP